MFPLLLPPLCLHAPTKPSMGSEACSELNEDKQYRETKERHSHPLLSCARMY